MMAHRSETASFFIFFSATVHFTQRGGIKETPQTGRVSKTVVKVNTMEYQVH